MIEIQGGGDPPVGVHTDARHDCRRFSAYAGFRRRRQRLFGLLTLHAWLKLPKVRYLINHRCLLMPPVHLRLRAQHDRSVARRVFVKPIFAGFPETADAAEPAPTIDATAHQRQTCLATLLCERPRS